MTITGHQTAITRHALSRPMRWLDEAGLLEGRCLDYGCGRGFDADALGIEGFDPHWRPDVDLPTGAFDTVTCNFVLNVVDQSTQNEILCRVLALLCDTGVAFFSVRRDLPREGAQGRGCWQRYVDEVEGAELIHEDSGFAVFRVGPAWSLEDEQAEEDRALGLG